MNWHALGATGQILGSLATFITVGYLAVQVSETREDVQRSIAQSRAERNMQLNLTFATDALLAGIHVKANDALTDTSPNVEGIRERPLPPFFEAATKQWGLTLEEAIKLYAELSARWNNMGQTILYVYELNRGDRQQFDNSIRREFEEPVFRFWYESNKPGSNPDMVRYVDDLLAHVDTGTN